MSTAFLIGFGWISLSLLLGFAYMMGAATGYRRGLEDATQIARAARKRSIPLERTSERASGRIA